MKRIFIISALAVLLSASCQVDFLPSLGEIKDTWVYADGSNYIEVLSFQGKEFSWVSKQGQSVDPEEGAVLQTITGTWKKKTYINYGKISYAVELIPSDSTQQITLNLEFTEGAQAVWLQSGNKKDLFYRLEKYNEQFAIVEEERADNESDESGKGLNAVTGSAVKEVLK